MSLFLNMMGDHPVEIECPNCQNSFNSTLQFFYDACFFPLLCPVCGQKINTHLEGPIALEIHYLKELIDELETNLNNFKNIGKFKIKTS
ncbi:hypothetical protein EDC14_100665 [Hydrogenispora ethanolica]|uniref:Uncharacterized protein n=1 Tax=Hydrogenispora ethanolica TaxID=1082276 RepID=A0A4R1RZS0_HYDET|nr:hypothetical protein [Hydrogenispora ethanolica]TCL72355.1 hypothetical protein EDC14_100665 [Hydrogenispora ethanolica]